MKKYIAVLVLLTVALMAVPVSAQDELIFPVGEGPFSWEDLEAFEALDLSGQEVSVLTIWTGDQSVNIERVLAYFEMATGANVIHAGSDSLEQQIVIDCAAGSPPDMVGFFQPGLAAEMAAADCLLPLPDYLRELVLEEYAAGQSWVDLGTYADPDGEEQFYGLIYRVDVKSLVWYVPDEFENAGYEVPNTMEELLDLSEQIVEDGGTPWCIGIASGDATGWPATDWVEDLLLRTQPPAVYDGWVTNEIPFNDERIVNAIELFGTFARNDDWVAGGSAAVATIDFRDSPRGLLTVPPACYMHRQGSFTSAFFPEGTQVGVDVDFFYFPAFEGEDLGQPVMGTGSLFTKTTDNEAVNALLDFLATPLAHELWMAQGGFLTANLGVNTEAYASDALQAQGDILLSATTFRFDGSDLMPGAIGAGAFWTGMVDYVSGASAQEVADAIQAAWDAIRED
jgi:alpha-glucoside transport system substrate-binding protein